MAEGRPVLDVRRREFLAALGGAAAWPLAARAQQRSMPVVGFLHSASPEPFANAVSAFRDGLAETGYIDGQNVAIEYRWAEGRYDRLPTLAADLIGRRVTIIVAMAGSAPAQAAKAATTSIPIVFVSGGDPVSAGLVASLNRPGGNVTGVSWVATALVPKQLELLRRLARNPVVVGALVNPSYPDHDLQLRELREAGAAIGQSIYVMRAASAQDIEAAFATFREQATGSLIIANDPFFVSRRDQIVALAAHYAIPAMYFSREFTAMGGLLSYSASLIEAARQGGIYTGKILKGARPADLPVMQPTKFELVINLKTAKVLGLDVPDQLLALADEVIE
jgi:putative tryptophan/tyrosine transport system substrate-binding protein